MLKKTVILTLLLTTIFSNVCMAKIITKNDSFHNTSTTESQYTKSTFMGLQEYYAYFGHNPTSNTQEWTLSFGVEVSGRANLVSFSRNAEIKIDGIVYSNLPYLDYYLDGYSSYGKLFGRYTIPTELIVKLKKAQKVAIRTTWNNGYGSISEILIEIPPKIIAEWQQIIPNTTETPEENSFSTSILDPKTKAELRK